MDTQKAPTLDVNLDKMKDSTILTPTKSDTQSSLDESRVEQVEPTLSPVEMAKKRNEARRCGHSDCKKRLVLTDVTCRCGITFCMTHRIGSAHSCTFDYKSANRPTAEQSKNLSAVPKKLTKI